MYEQKICDYLRELGAKKAVPGGGAVAALNGAQGAALVMMVANFTVGKERYTAFEELCLKARDEAEQLRDVLEQGIDDDKEAFALVSAAYGMPKNTDEEKEARKDAIAEASVKATEAPLGIMRSSIKGLELAHLMIGNSNPNLVSDLYVAADCFNAAIRSASYNVLVNTPSIKDRGLAEKFEAECRSILEEGDRLAAEIRKQD